MNKSAIGKILGALGALLLISVPVTLLILGPSPFVWVKLGLGMLLVAAYVGLNAGNMGQIAKGRSSFFLGSTLAAVGVVLALLAAVNFIAVKRNKTWDITSKKVNSLAPQTTGALRDLKEKVTALAFADPKDAMYAYMEALLVRYRTEAPEKFDFAFKSPLKAPDLVQKYQLRQGQNAIVLTRGEGASESHTTVTVPSEQELTNGLLKLAQVGEKKVYFLSGHGEWTAEAPPNREGMGVPATESSITELFRELTQEGYAPVSINLAGKTEVPRDAAMVIVAGPKQPVTAPEMETLRRYLLEGGRLLVFAEAQTDTGLDKLLADYGLQLDKGILADARFAVESPYNLLSIFYGNHEITKLLQSQTINTLFVTARGITLLREGVPSTVRTEPLVLTSPGAWEESTPNQEPQPSDGEKTGSIPIAAVASKEIGTDIQQKRNDEARVVLFGDSELLVDAFWGHEGDRNLVLNSLAWATNQVQKVTIRPPDRDLSVIDLDKDMQARVILVSTDLLPLALLAVGLTIWMSRRNK